MFDYSLLEPQTDINWPTHAPPYFFVHPLDHSLEYTLQTNSKTNMLILLKDR